MPFDCEAVADLLDHLDDHGADRALPAATAAEVERHLADCPACATELAAIRALQRDLAALREDTAPPELAGRILAALPPAPAITPRRRTLELLAAGFAGLALGAGGLRLATAPADDLPAHDLFAAHGRALLAGTPLQVASGNPHGVRPWLSAHLPFAPRTEDPEGFPLQGARLDLVGGQPVAAIVYRRREHVVTVFAAPAEAARDWPATPLSRRRINLLPWIAEGMHYVAVSDLNPAELMELRRLLGG